MMTDNLLATLENTLRQTRASRSRLASRLSEVEREAASLKAEIAEMDALAAQTEATMYRFMSAVLGSPTANQPPPPNFYAPVQTQEYAPQLKYNPAAQFAPQVFTEPVGPEIKASEPPAASPVVSMTPAPLEEPPVRGEDSDPKPLVAVEDYTQLTIPQATARLLAKAGRPLHVNEIYEHLRSGGFVFSGHNPTISIAVSLNRNQRFNKVSPGTFGLAK